jgi:predicted ribosomally synthesized peptide with SipW-like signal peptide
MNISRIVLALLLIVGAGGAVATGTSAFFSDTETSTGNTFTAGALDLKIDNESYYNGNKCTNVGTEQAPIWQWVGNAGFPEAGTPCTTSFGQSDLDSGLVFFDFDDLKPDDEGEDTISIHVQNDAWACMDLTLTSNNDNSSNEPELGDGDAQDVVEDAWDGELAQTLDFFWWADDGDNVYEVGENPLTPSDGVVSLLDLAPQNDAFSIVLADSQGNAWGGVDPLPANQTVYIAKAWCMGDMTLAPVQAGLGVNPSIASGIICDGTLLDNKTQTDGVELTVAFRAEQARNNGRFLCNPPDQQDEFGTLTVNKALLVSTAGIEVADFTLHIVGPNGDQIVSDEVPVANLPVGNYTVHEVITGDVGGHTFTTTFSGVCTSGGNTTTSDVFVLGANDNITCNILNNQIGDGIGD